MTLGVFLPAFGFSLLLHNQLERLMEREVLREVLEGVSAGVVGIIASTLITLGVGTITNIKAAVIFGLALIPLYFWKSKAVIPCVVIGAGVLGWFLFRRVHYEMDHAGEGKGGPGRMLVVDQTFHRCGSRFYFFTARYRVERVEEWDCF
jgi:chromate transport protein ChrA